MPWLLNFVYGSAGLALLPWLLFRRLYAGKRVAGLVTKLTGSLPDRPPHPRRIWFHAVSVGEVLLLRRIIEVWLTYEPEAEIVITTTTGTGYEVARREYPNYTVCYFPLDFSWAVHRALERIQPSLVVLAELEIWPNFLRAAHQRNIPVYVVNGRLSQRSFSGYQRFGMLSRSMLRKLTGVAAQTPEYADRFIALGVPRDRVVVTGSVKYEGLETNRSNPKTQQLRAALGIGVDEIVWIAGSTQSPEEAISLKIWQQLSRDVPSLRLIIVPRHKERFEEVARLLAEKDVPHWRRSQGDISASAAPVGNPVILLDTLGELAACWGLADIAFVGGSLTFKRGGQNMIEPAAYGAAVLTGPSTANFRATVQLLHDHDALLVVRDEDEYYTRVRELLSDTVRRKQLGRNAQHAVLGHAGAAQRTYQFVTSMSARLHAQPVRRAG